MKRTLILFLVLLGACRGKARTRDLDAGVETQAQALDRACLARDLEACRSLGVLHAQGRGVPQDDRRAAALFGVACEGGNAAACNNLGLLAADDSERAETLYRQACDGDSALACRNLGLLLQEGGDTAGAAAAFADACDAGLPPACTNLGLIVSDAHEDERAASLFQQACEGGDPIGCRYVGLAYVAGRGLPKGDAPARVWFDRACAGGDGGGCLFRAELEPDAVKVDALRARACGLGMTDACPRDGGP